MKDSTSVDEREELKNLKNGLTPERAFQLVNDAIEVRLKSPGNILAGRRIFVKLNVELPW